MNSNRADNYKGDDAALYDQQYTEHGCHGHEVLFGLMYEFIKPNETLLDIGIGTGLSSFLFHRAGLQISGFDFSKEMLEVCESKGFAAHLVQYDLRHVPFPYPENSFNNVVSLGVLNFYSDLGPVFKETSRIIRPHGILGFSVEEQKPGQQAKYVFRINEDPDQKGEETSVTMYRHSDGYIRELLGTNGFTVLKDFEFLADQYPEQGIKVYFKAYVAQKTEFA